MTTRSIELFAGAGGLALGLSKAGIVHEAVVEWDRHACETIRTNQRLGVEPPSHWPAPTEGDVRDFSFLPFAGIDLVTGGPPCQPFSMGGKHRAYLDERDMFPQAIRAIRETRPRAFIFENVRGLVRSTFVAYFKYILAQMTFPSLVAQNGEEWGAHARRLDMHVAEGGSPEYEVEWRLVNAADYGVPQQRWRVIFVGFKAELGRRFAFPEPTHSQDALTYSQWVTGDYWRDHKIRKSEIPKISAVQIARASRLSQLDASEIKGKRWKTVRDALAGMPDPEHPTASAIQAHRFQPGARSYQGHTGSPMDAPAKALKAGDHGVPGGENMLRRLDGSVRYFTVRESARLQTFPDAFIFDGTWSEVMRQLGNAVPVELAAVIGTEVVRQMKQKRKAKASDHECML
jgi:DNA (cytosine-5)-methyltransferase 1